MVSAACEVKVHTFCKDPACTCSCHARKPQVASKDADA